MNDIKEALKKALEIYPENIVKWCEQLFRLETRHFKSKQFLKCLAPGMEAFSINYPYGWITINKIFWSKYPQYKPVGKYKIIENRTGIEKTFLIFPSVKAGIMTVCAFLNYYNNPGRWYSTNTNKQKEYTKNVENFKTPIFNELTGNA